jgi:Flp pilus assembly protein TadG
LVQLSGDSSGNAVVEFALVLPIMLMILFGITEFGRAFAVVQVLNASAREGARLAAVTAPDQGAVTARVNEVLAAAAVTPASITLEGPVGNPEATVRVTVTSNFTIFSGTVLGDFSGTIALQGAAVMRHES